MNEPDVPRRRVLVAITGASGAIYGWRLLHVLRGTPDIESHLIVSPPGWTTLRHELDLGPDDLRLLTDHLHDVNDLGAGPASGSFRCHGMVIAPCSMRSLAAVAHGLTDNLITRAADVMLKERRRLVLMSRETPLHLGHLRNMTAVTEMGGIVCPPMPAFYLRPRDIGELVDASIARVLDLLELPHTLSRRWTGLPRTT
ncbi:MAG: UbiX family flavin prenyltransferase [Hydrogenophaga sp.]|jgi:4-hydroxy-3-polyprenylbenzoate decarboxylase|nr:UbiX family flavin prenyltransferase [Hydrogenophaga sp.]